jgi:adenylate kinase family enzyme
MSQDAPFVAAVLGVDGSGKSTLSRRLAVDFSVRHATCLIGDRAEVFDRGVVTDLHAQLTEHLRRRIAAHAKEATSLDRYKVPKIAELVLRDRLLGEVAPDYRLDMVFMDGMPVLNLAAWTILYNEGDRVGETCQKIMAALTRRGGALETDDPVFAQFPELMRLHELGFDHLHVPDATIFLDVPPEVCVARIDSRGKAKQVHETPALLSRLRDAYLAVCDTLEREWKQPVLVLAGDRDADVATAEARAFVENARGARDGG